MSEPVLAGFSHGTSSPIGQRLVSALMGAVAAELPEGVTRLGFVDVQQPDVPATLASVDPESPVVVVPLLLSAGYHVHVDLHRAVQAHDERPIVLTGALGPDERLTAVLVRRLEEAGLRHDDALVLSVAGSSDPRAIADCEVVAEQLAAATGHEVTLGYLSAAEPRLEDAVRAAGASGPTRRGEQLPARAGLLPRSGRSRAGATSRRLRCSPHTTRHRASSSTWCWIATPRARCAL